ncbi:MAG: universal stress protein [Bacteroidales bacterium]|nr:universal stress protein [Bacteroidales bacterium]
MKNIIVGIDFSNSSMVAMRHAIAISLKTKADIHLVWIKSPGVSSSAEEFDEGKSFVMHNQEKLQEWAKLCKDESPETHVNTVILEGKPHIEINKYANNLPESMIVLGAHGASGFEEGYIGNNAYRMINNADVPILIMRENISINRDLHKIFIPIDTSFETLQKMRAAIYLAKGFAAQLYLFGVNYPNDPSTRHVINIQLRHAADMCEEANVRYVAESFNVCNNDVCNIILKCAKEVDANLITIMREEAETDFTASRNMREILSTSPMPLLIIPNKNAFSVAK